MARKNILFLVSSLVFGGAERQVVSLLNGLDTSLCNPNLVYLKARGELLPSIKAERVGHVSCLDVGRRLDMAGIRRLARLIDELEIDVIVCTNEYPLLYAIPARLISGRRSRCRILEVFHTTQLSGTYAAIKMNLLYRWLFRLVEKNVFVSSNQMAYWVSKGISPASRSTYIWNGIDVEFFRDRLSPEDKLELRASLGIAPDEYVLGICAVLREEKKHIDLLRAARILKDRGMRSKVLIIGDGSQRREIEAFVESNEMADDVVITGFQDDVRPFLSISDVICLVSHRVETFSIALLEALAMGKPVVSSNIGGASEIVKPGKNGFLFERGDIDALANHLEKLQSSGLRAAYGAEGRKMAEQFFSVAQMLRQYESVLLS